MSAAHPSKVMQAAHSDGLGLVVAHEDITQTQH